MKELLNYLHLTITNPVSLGPVGCQISDFVGLLMVTFEYT